MRFYNLIHVVLFHGWVTERKNAFLFTSCEETQTHSSAALTRIVCLKLIVRAHQTLKSNLYLQAMYCKITWSPPFKLLKPWIVELSVWETVHAYHTTLNQSASNKTSVSWITQTKSRVLSATALTRIQFTMRTFRYYFFFFNWENKRKKMKSEYMWWSLILLLSKETRILSYCYRCYLPYYYYHYYYYY